MVMTQLIDGKAISAQIKEELKEIRSKFSKEIIDNDLKTGVATW